MSLRTEAEEWAEERARIERKQSARKRAFVAWFMRVPKPDHFVWHSVAELIEDRS